MIDRVTDTKLWEIRHYIDSTKVPGKKRYLLTSKELLALGKFTHQDFYGAILLAFTYGWAKGYRAAKGLPPNLQSEPETISPEDAEILELAKSLDEVNTNAFLALMRALARGEDNETALAAGNAVLIAAGRKPMPPMY